MAKQLLSFISCLALIGCASSQYVQAPPYIAPVAGTPQALLYSRLPVISNNRYSTSLSVVDDKSCASTSLFYVSKYSKPEESAKPIAMFAEKLVTLHYNATLPGNRTCDVYARGRFEAGKNYSLYGGSDVPTGLAGLFDNGTCSFGILDESSQQALPLAQVKSACAK
ncbi:hypothetical protein OIK44_18975 [Janthinobacterium sp. hw3]|uniref:Lipoprotein n=2 Tax=Janthinobacterium fluminis TaxID=2987524 RepID=A0ABT5K6H4_9BURK|nr:hypothetical protein [Janthinobacterium fluminis]